MKPFTQTADTLDQELADKIDGILAAHGEDPTQLVASCWTWRPRWSGTTSRRPPPTMWRSAWG